MGFGSEPAAASTDKTFFYPGGKLMPTHARAVDHLDLASADSHGRMPQAIPHAGLSSAVETVVGRRARRVALGNTAQGCAVAQNPEDAIEHPPVVLWIWTVPIHLQARFDDAPLEVGQIVAHDPSSDGSQLQT